MSASLWKRATATRWVYGLENSVLRQNKWAVRERKFAELHRFLVWVWSHEAPGGWDLPKLEFGRGVKYGANRVSYNSGVCGGEQVIHLVRWQRNHMVLLHEITHAMGPVWHGKSFVRVYFPLLIKYGRYDRDLIESLAFGRGLLL